MKLSKQERKAHEAALARLHGGNLNEADRESVYRGLRPEATTDIGKGSAFFTPWEVAGDFCVETLNGYDEPTRILDLCAGYGVLSLRKWLYGWGTSKPEVTCVEINPEYVAIGKQLFPEARWICADVFDVPSILEGEKFDEFYSNPPFGRIPVEAAWGGRSGRKPARFEYAVAEIGMQMAETGTMIGQQGISDWKFSGCRSFTRIENAEYSKWSEQSGLILSDNCGLDCSHTPFNATNIMVDIFNVQRADEE